MRGHCDDYGGYQGGRNYGGCHGHGQGSYEYGPRYRCLDDLPAEERKKYLEDEKRILEARLKNLESRIAETSQ